MKRLNSSDVERALGEGLDLDFEGASKAILECLGYRSERTLPGQSGEVADFLSRSRATSRGTLSEQQFREHALSLRVLFQITDEEIESSAQPSLFDSLGEARFDKNLFKSYVFIAVELKQETFSRSRYAEMAREINKHLAMPGFVLFRTKSGLLTLAFVHRRQHKRDPNRQVLGRVSLVREIDPANPHRAHLDILAELSLNERLKWIRSHGKRPNFDGLLAALLDTLDTQALNKRFYKDLFEWFTRAAKESKFPTREVRTLSSEEHVIRLITRLLFVWFMKEKGLVAEKLFVEEEARSILKDYDRKKGDSYYRAILQNLFFATLNCEISERRWSEKQNSTHRIFSRYRFGDEVENPERLLELFAQTPFINGGLFDCLDSLESKTNGGYRIDCFSDNVTNPKSREFAQISVPNRIFFDERGLFAVFNRYKFTVEENTPAEKEVALDPELLGSVFENLLAAYNPETRATARKQTGSYYTPRPVVDYMVEEALVEALAEKALPTDGDEEFWRERLRYLLDYEDAFSDAKELFEEVEIDELIRAISKLKVLDPACGSGAFPMGVLHKLTLALRRIDPDNHRWEALQKKIAGEKATRAFDMPERRERDAKLSEISNIFEGYRSSDFGRKLYLIQNSIFGADIQPVACQIAKLRFFISLVIEQQLQVLAPNLGIRPLPNLETRFLAADSLLGLNSREGHVLASDRTLELEAALRMNRERHFHAQTRRQKLETVERDVELRTQLASELRDVGLPSGDAGRVAQWNPYDQNDVADWFDPEYMFGINSGFDVILANPPYVESRSNLVSPEKKAAYARQVKDDWQGSVSGGSDLLIYFFCRAAKLISDVGHCVFISQNAWLTTDYGRIFQRFSKDKFWFSKIIDTEGKFFADIGSQNINAVITVCGRERRSNIDYGLLDPSMALSYRKSVSATRDDKWGHLIAMPDSFAEALVRVQEKCVFSSPVKFGQGLNFPKSHLGSAGGHVPVVVKSAQFVSSGFDENVDVPLSDSRKQRIPALFMPRGVGNRHYCSLNIGKAYTYSHVEVYLPKQMWLSDLHYCLWAYLNSSFVWMYREITGRKNLGGGMLKAEATDMKGLPVGFKFEFGADARRAVRMHGREPLPIPDEIHSKEHAFLDDLVFEHLGIGDVKEDIRSALIEMVGFRVKRSRGL